MTEFIITEKTILAGVITNNEKAILVYEQLLAEDYQFYKENLLWKRIADQQLLENESISTSQDTADLIVNLRIDDKDLEDLISLTNTESIDFKKLYERLIDLKPLEAKRDVLQAYAEKLFVEVDEKEREELLDEFELRYFAVKNSLKQKDLAELTDESIEEVNLYQSGKLELLKTQIFQLDTKITGIKAEDIFVVGAYSGHGKTGLLVQLSLGLLRQNKKVLFISNEMSEIEIQTRFASHAAKVSENVISNEERHQESLEKLKKGMIENKEKYNGKLTIVRKTSFEKALRLMKVAFRAGVADVIVLDYLQNFVSEKDFHDERSKISYICSELIEFSKGYRIPIIVSSQTTQKDTDSYKGAQDIRNMATVGLVMERDYNPSEDNGDGRIYFKAKITVVKSRRGSTGIIYGKIYAPDPTFKDVTPKSEEISEWDFKTYTRK